MNRDWLLTRLLFAVLLVAPGAATAQSAAPDRKWEVEVHGGVMFAATPADGTGSLPAPGPTAPLLRGGRVVSSWYFGDGALQLNQAVLLGADPPFGVVALDPVLQSQFVRREPGATFGIRITRALTRRFAAELAVDYSAAPLVVTDESLSGLETTRASYLTAWNTVLPNVVDPGFAVSRRVNSVSAISDRRGSQIVAAGTLLVNVRPSASLSPYVAVGVASVSSRLGAPRARVSGDYTVTFTNPPPPIPIQMQYLEQTDTVTVRSSAHDALAWIVGGGFKFALSERWGVRVDVRDHMSRNNTSTLVDAESSTARRSYEFFVGPIQGPRLGFPTSLSGAPITGFETFKGTGVNHQLDVTCGLFWRF